MSEGISVGQTLPPDWTVANLSELVDRSSPITYGVVQPGPEVPDGVSFVRGGDIFGGRIAVGQLRTISQEVSESYRRTLLNGGELLMSLVGYPGEVAIVPNDLAGANIARQAALLRIGTQHHAKFVMYFLLSDMGKRRIFEQSNGSAQQVVNLADLNRVRVNLPPLPQQRRITEILATLDNMIEKTEALIAKYHAVKQGMMHDLFTRGVDEHGQLRPPHAEAPELFKQSELGWIPKEWNCCRLGEALRIAGGFLQTGPFGSQLHSYEYVEEGVPVVMPQDITDGRILTDQIARISRPKADSMARHRLRFNDVVFSRRGDLSRAAAISSAEEGWICGTGCFLLRCVFERLDANWIGHQYVMPHVQRQVDANAVGSTMPSLNNAVMERLLMSFPSAEEQREIGKRVTSIEAMQANCHLTLHKLAITKAGLMQDLFTGKVRVKVNDSDEVAADV